VKPGYLTTEFWLTIVANVLVQAGALGVPERYKWLVTLATVTGYALSRGLAKVGPAAVPSIADELDGTPDEAPLTVMPAADPARLAPDQGDAGKP
jgi:hypothetical protein